MFTYNQVVILLTFLDFWTSPKARNWPPYFLKGRCTGLYPTPKPWIFCLTPPKRLPLLTIFPFLHIFSPFNLIGLNENHFVCTFFDIDTVYGDFFFSIQSLLTRVNLQITFNDDLYPCNFPFWRTLSTILYIYKQ